MMTLPPRTTPTVSLCACAAIGTLIAPAIAAMASILFRMLNSFARVSFLTRFLHANRYPLRSKTLRRRPTPAPNASQFIARGIVPEKAGRIRGNFGHFSGQVSCCFCLQFFRRPEPIDATSVCYSGTSPAGKLRPSIRFSGQHQKRRHLKMTLTVAHISPIMSVVAGVLILIMPRLLNLIVALFLILNGIIGLGLLRWLHL